LTFLVLALQFQALIIHLIPHLLLSFIINSRHARSLDHYLFAWTFLIIFNKNQVCFNRFNLFSHQFFSELHLIVNQDLQLFLSLFLLLIFLRLLDLLSYFLKSFPVFEWLTILHSDLNVFFLWFNYHYFSCQFSLWVNQIN
jgi:hypothetical protein